MPATYTFYLKDRTDKKGRSSIYLRIYHGGTLKYLPTGIKVEPSQWNDDRQEVRKSYDTYKKLNQDLDILLEKGKQAERELSRMGSVSAEEIKERMENGGESTENFFTLAKEYQQELKNGGTYHTHKQAKVSFGKLQEYHGSGELPLSEMDVEYMDKFQKHLKNKVGNKASTIRKNFTPISAVLDLAEQRNLIQQNPLDSKSFTLVKNNKPKSKTKLSMKQVKKLEDAKVQPGTNRFHARNAWVFSYYCAGMRFGDIAELTWGNIKEDRRLHYRMGKTDTEVNIPLPKGAKKILAYYENEDKKDSDYIFPFLQDLTDAERKDKREVRRKSSSANVIVNDRIKKVTAQPDVGIKESISMHSARHSFAWYACDVKEIPLAKLAMLLGHSNLKTTQQYLKTISVKSVTKAMESIFD